MSTLSRKLFISVLALIMTVGAFTATTFAWFTLGDTVSVGNIEGTVVSGEGLEMRLVYLDEVNSEYVPATNWSSFISAGEISTYLDPNTGNWKFNEFSAVTSAAANGADFERLAITYTGANPGLAMVAAEKSNYVKLSFEFRSLTAGDVGLNEVTLTGTPSTWKNEGNSFTGNDDTAVNPNESITEDISNGARISFVGLLGGSQTVVGVEQDENHGNNNVLGKGENTKGSHSFFKAQNDFNTEYNDLHSAFNPITFVEASNVVPATNKVVTLVDEGTGYAYGTIDVYVWIEGWDQNAFNAVFGQTLTVGLSFKRNN